MNTQYGDEKLFDLIYSNGRFLHTDYITTTNILLVSENKFSIE